MMKKLLALLLAALLVPCAMAEEAVPVDERLLAFDKGDYAELSADEIPDGELTEELLSSLTDAHAAMLLDSVLPWLSERGYLREVPRSAFMDWEATQWTDCQDSFWDLYDVVDSGRIDSLPRFTLHSSADCSNAANRTCNYFATYFFSLETIFDPCTVCYPSGWSYEYIVTGEIDGLNSMEITPRFEAEPGILAQPRQIRLQFDHGTDECVFIAVEYPQQGYIIVHQAADFPLSGIVSVCPDCEEDSSAYWYRHEPGLWHCRSCGALTELPLK